MSLLGFGSGCLSTSLFCAVHSAVHAVFIFCLLTVCIVDFWISAVAHNQRLTLTCTEASRFAVRGAIDPLAFDHVRSEVIALLERDALIRWKATLDWVTRDANDRSPMSLNDTDAVTDGGMQTFRVTINPMTVTSHH